jgi:hypothetical protein
MAAVGERDVCSRNGCYAIEIAFRSVNCYSGHKQGPIDKGRDAFELSMVSLYCHDNVITSRRT